MLYIVYKRNIHPTKHFTYEHSMIFAKNLEFIDIAKYFGIENNYLYASIVTMLNIKTYNFEAINNIKSYLNPSPDVKSARNV